ncbi:MAG: hypothetical protein ACUVRE_06505 [Thermoanaerobaculaceae bacterium]
MRAAMHPFLIPASWLLYGDYFPTEGKKQKVKGTTIVTAHEQFPESLRVTGEVRDAEDAHSRPVTTEYVLDLVAPGRVRFHMDSIALGTVLVGQGVWTRELLLFHYASPDKRIFGNETVAASGEDLMHTSGILLVDGVPVTYWLAHLQRVD